MAKASISRAWDDTRAVVARDGRLLAAVALALLVLPGLIGDMVLPQPKAGANGMPDISGSRIAVMGIILLISLVGQLALIRLASVERVTVGGAIGHAARRAPVYIAAILLWLLPFVLIAVAIGANINPSQTPPSAGAAGGVLLGFLILFFGAFYVLIRMLMTGPVASNEAIGPVAIVRRSWELTRGNWLRLFGFFVLFFIMLVVVMVAVGAVVGTLARVMFGDFEPMTIGTFIVSLVSQLAGAVLSVLLSVMLARIYVQLTGPAQAAASVPSSVE